MMKIKKTQRGKKFPLEPFLWTPSGNSFSYFPPEGKRVKLLSLPGDGEKQQLKNTPVRVNNQEEIGLPRLLLFLLPNSMISI
jgi:hypothetical protein